MNNFGGKSQPWCAVWHIGADSAVHKSSNHFWFCQTMKLILFLLGSKWSKYSNIVVAFCYRDAMKSCGLAAFFRVPAYLVMKILKGLPAANPNSYCLKWKVKMQNLARGREALLYEERKLKKIFLLQIGSANCIWINYRTQWELYE